jgi:hypothetical protein
MSKNQPAIKGYLKPYIEQGKPGFQVGAEDPTSSYKGPVADVAWDNVWLHIETDPYEGHVMLNIEALEPLRKALAKISRARKDSALRQGEF